MSKLLFQIILYFTLVIIHAQSCLQNVDTITDNVSLQKKNGATYRIMSRYKEPFKDLTRTSEIKPNNVLALKNHEVVYSIVFFVSRMFMI